MQVAGDSMDNCAKRNVNHVAIARGQYRRAGIARRFVPQIDRARREMEDFLAKVAV